MHRKNNQTGVVTTPKIGYLRHQCRRYVIYDTAARSAHTPRIGQMLPRLLWHGVELALIVYPKRPSIRRDTSYPGETRRIITPVSHIILFTTPVSQIPYLRHRVVFAVRTSDRLDAVTAGLVWCRAMIEAVMYPKRSSTRRDTYTWYPPVPAALLFFRTVYRSSWCVVV